MNNLSVVVDGDSPTGLQRYLLLHSPKSALISRSKLPLIFLFFGAGFILGGTWSKIGFRMASGGVMFPNSQPIASAETYLDDTAKSFLRRKRSASGSLPIAWLMSFPNSGTSYTSYLVRTATGTNTASNYGTENVGKDGTSVAVLKESPGGPFWTDPLSKKYVRPKSGYLLTKTHCGGRCDQCQPEKYIENHKIFSRRCFEGYHISKDANGERAEILGSYSKDLVARAVHLIRDPFDNVVSRFHLSFKHFVKKNQTEKIAMYPRSKDGFRAFCKDLGNRFYKEEKAARFFRDVFNDVKNIPCHADFYRYIQWHDLAFTTAWDLRIPTMILHYENYTDNFNQTKDLLFNFLDQESVHEPPHFETGKTYREYFTEEEIQAVSTMFSKLALDKTWDHTKHYFQ